MTVDTSRDLILLMTRQILVGDSLLILQLLFLVFQFRQHTLALANPAVLDPLGIPGSQVSSLRGMKEATLLRIAIEEL